MCMCSGFYPPAGSEIFFQMEPGDEIRVKPGFGSPMLNMELIEIVVAVDGYSALTQNGRRLMCDDAFGLELTGNHFEEGTYTVSAKAQEIMEEAAANRDDSDAGWLDEDEEEKDPEDWLPHH